MKILLAEDDRNLAPFCVLTRSQRLCSRLCVNGLEALEVFSKEPFDFCVVDVMMPVKDGFTLAKDIRKVDSQIHSVSYG